MLHLDPEGDFFRSQVPSVDAGLMADLQVVTRRMADNGFVESNIEAAMQIRPLTFRRRQSILPLRRRLKTQSALGLAVGFWLLQEWLSLEEARLALGDHAISALHRMGWLQLSSLGLRSRVDLYPCCGRYFFTDTANSDFPWPAQVYWLGGDSYTLAYCTPRSQRGRALDICTGSGIHAILARVHCGHSTGLDINPRALEFSRLNARLNNLETDFLSSDCYQAVSDQQYDLVTLNPPFVPTPENIAELYRAGGGTGESVTRRVIDGLPTFLRPGGLFSMATEAPRRGQESPLQRMLRWLGSTGWGLAALYKYEFPADDYILGHVLAGDLEGDQLEAEFQRWCSSYEAAGITSMTAAQFYAVRLPAGHSSWGWERNYPHPLQDQSGFLESWLRALTKWHSPWPLDFRPKLHPAVRQIYFAEDAVMVEWQSTRWCAAPLRFGGEHARVLQRVQQGASLSEIAGAESAVRELGAELVIDCWE